MLNPFEIQKAHRERYETAVYIMKRAFRDWAPSTPHLDGLTQPKLAAFYYYLWRKYGIRVAMSAGYDGEPNSVTSVEIHDKKKYTLFVLQYGDI